MIRKISILIILFLLANVNQGAYVFAEDDMYTIPDINEYPVKDFKYKKNSLYADFFDNHFWDPLESYVMPTKIVEKLLQLKQQAPVINAFDEVPDSPFFQNRNGKKALSAEELKKGANVNSGPDTSQQWTIIKGKVTGRNPGFFIKDSKGDSYLIKLDRRQYPEMISSCEVIASKFFYAIGYNVPQYTVVYFDEKILTVRDGATFYDTDGFKKPFTLEKALGFLKESSYKTEKGLYRAVASKIVDGVPLGYVSFHSNRKNDALDPVLHEDRREMRGLYVFASWMNHHDCRRGNTLDMVIEDADGWYIKKYLIDFGSCLGSHNMYYKYASAGHTNLFDVPETLKSFLSLGLYKRPYYREIKPFSPAVGYITSDVFRPGKWQPMIPNSAFDSMTKRDAFWATKIVMSFTDEQVSTIVDAGELSQQRDRTYLTNTIIKRRDLIGKYWFTQINPLENFSCSMTKEGAVLTFDNLYETYGFTTSDDVYTYSVEARNADDIDWDDAETLWSSESKTGTINLPTSLVRNKKGIVAAINILGSYKAWEKPVFVTFDSDGTNLRITGITREE